MTPRISLSLIVIALVAMPACNERKHATEDGGLPGDANVPDTIVGPVIDGGAPAVDTSGLDTGGAPSPIDTALDLASTDLPPSGTDVPGQPEVPPSDVLIASDLPADAPLPDTPPAPDVAPDLPADNPPVTTDTPADLGPDAPVTNPDVPGTCPSNQRLCGTSCIDLSACCTSADCTGTCQTCNTSHACVPAVSQADPTGRCLGTCDSTGTCKSKQGQACQTVAAGCESGTTCSPDGICCENGCVSPCMACDIPGYLGLCTPVASGNPHGNRASCGTDPECAGTCAGHVDGTCEFPTKGCGSGPVCSGTDAVIPKGSCFQGACAIPSVQPCTGGLVCAAGACKTSCASDADCQANYFCQSSTCHPKVAQVALGEENVCAVDVTGAVYCWGRNLYGILGQDPASVTNSNTPVKITSLTSAKSVAVGSDFACALMTSGGVYCWGYADSGRLGSTPSGSYSTSPLAVSGLSSGVSGISASHGSACAYTSTNALWCWGDNIYKELGAGVSANYSATPINIGLAGTTAVAVGDSTICAVAGGRVYCWGNNSNGQAGSSGGGSLSSPTLVSGLTAAMTPQSISSNGYSSCAVMSGGGVYCWGWNSYGALGNSSITIGADSSSAVQVQSLSTGASSVAVGFLRGCALLVNSAVSCWGLERYGGLGDGITGSESYTLTPYTITALGNVSILASGRYHSCAIRTNGSLACWGYGYWGEMGNGFSADASTPVDVKAW
jgi:alpha-tubulin suppressor-like RCC1 family protein